MVGFGHHRRLSAPHGFTLVEVLICLAVVGGLMSILLPALGAARRSAYKAVCVGNLRQVGAAFQAYVHDHGGFPQHQPAPDWSYGGAKFTVDHTPLLDPARPVNRYVNDDLPGGRELAMLFRCPADSGVYPRRDAEGRNRASVLAAGSCFATYGTSYRANPALLDSTRAGIDTLHRPLKPDDVFISTSQMLLAGDATWWYATRPAIDADSKFEASWHDRRDAAHALALDGSVRFTSFNRGSNAPYVLMPRPGAGR